LSLALANTHEHTESKRSDLVSYLSAHTHTYGRESNPIPPLVSWSVNHPTKQQADKRISRSDRLPTYLTLQIREGSRFLSPRDPSERRNLIIISKTEERVS
jgi:hypothetical protein